MDLIRVCFQKAWIIIIIIIIAVFRHIYIHLYTEACYIEIEVSATVLFANLL